ncbi:hypothetical protein Tco_1504958 [Tanacetum coccineum]
MRWVVINNTPIAFWFLHRKDALGFKQTQQGAFGLLFVTSGMRLVVDSTAKGAFCFGLDPHRVRLGLRSPTRASGAFGIVSQIGSVWFDVGSRKGAAAATMGYVWWAAAAIGVRLAGTATQGVFGLLFRGTGVFGFGFNTQSAFGCGFSSKRLRLVSFYRNGCDWFSINPKRVRLAVGQPKGAVGLTR